MARIQPIAPTAAASEVVAAKTGYAISDGDRVAPIPPATKNKPLVKSITRPDASFRNVVKLMVSGSSLLMVKYFIATLSSN